MAASQRSMIFGGEAEAYDRFRPSYPPEIIDLIVDHRPAVAVDAGCGTGKAATLVSQRGVTVIGVEPDQRMAAIARRHGIDVTVSALEDWVVIDCDLLYSAQAWHWVDPLVGAEIAASSIRPGGRWAAFWNREVDTHLGAVRDDVYRRLSPASLEELVTSDDDEFRAGIAQGLRATGAFGELTAGEVAWTDHVTVDEVVERLASHSQHRLLDPSTSTAINDALRNELGAPTDVLALSYSTLIFTATRR